MRVISSRTTFFYKRVFPVVWFGFLAIMVLAPLLLGGKGAQFPLPFFIVPIVMMGFGYVLMKRMVFDLVDEVVDLGDALLVKNGGKEDRIALANITNVGYVPLMSPPRVTLSLRTPSVFGSKVTFCAPVRVMPFAGNPVVEGLITRIDAARRN